MSKVEPKSRKGKEAGKDAGPKVAEAPKAREDDPASDPLWEAFLASSKDLGDIVGCGLWFLLTSGGWVSLVARKGERGANCTRALPDEEGRRKRDWGGDASRGIHDPKDAADGDAAEEEEAEVLSTPVLKRRRPAAAKLQTVTEAPVFSWVHMGEKPATCT